MDAWERDHIHKTGAAIVADDKRDEQDEHPAERFTHPPLRSIETGPTDAQLGEQYREEMRQALTYVCNVMTRANRDKIGVAYSLGNDAFGQTIISQLVISKVL